MKRGFRRDRAEGFGNGPRCGECFATLPIKAALVLAKPRFVRGRESRGRCGKKEVTRGAPAAVGRRSAASGLRLRCRPWSAKQPLPRRRNGWHKTNNVPCAIPKSQLCCRGC